MVAPRTTICIGLGYGSSADFGPWLTFWHNVSLDTPKTPLLDTSWVAGSSDRHLSSFISLAVDWVATECPCWPLTNLKLTADVASYRSGEPHFPRFVRYRRTYHPQGVRVQNRARTTSSATSRGAHPYKKSIKVTPHELSQIRHISWSPSDRWWTPCQNTRAHTQQLWHIDLQ